MKEKKTNKPKREKGRIRAFLKSRKAKHGVISVAITAVFVAAVIVVNIICGLLVDRFPEIKLDFTSNKAFAIQDDTAEYMNHLDNDVTVNVLMSESTFEAQSSYFVQAKNLLEKMESSSNGKLTVKYVDVSSNPSFASKYPDVDWSSGASNLVIVESGDQYRALGLDDCFEYDAEAAANYGYYNYTGTKIEQAVVTAVLNVTTTDKAKACFITGNQEQDYSGVKTLLENNAYEVSEVSLATGDLDADAVITFLFSPAVDLDESATEKLSAWLNNDGKQGKTLIYIPCADKVETPNLDDFLKEWGMQVNEGYVFETSPNMLVSNSSPYAFVTQYTDYYTDGLKNSSIPVVTSDSHDIIINDTATAHALLTTTNAAGVYPLDADESWNYNDAITGEPLNIAAEGVKDGGETGSSRVIVFGSYMMFTKDVLKVNSFNNSAYLMNIVNTVSDKQDSGITIESKSLDNKELGVTDITTSNLLTIIFIVVVPAIVLIIGIIVWIRRRNK